MASALMKRGRGRFEIDEKAHTEKTVWRWRRERCSHKPRNANSHQKLEEAKNGFSPTELKLSLIHI